MASRVRLALSGLSCLVNVSPRATVTVCVSIASSADPSNARNLASADRVYSNKQRYERQISRQVFAACSAVQKGVQCHFIRKDRRGRLSCKTFRPAIVTTLLAQKRGRARKRFIEEASTLSSTSHA